MATNNPPEQGPGITAAELRRRLLASGPPLPNAAASVPVPEPEPEPEPEAELEPEPMPEAPPAWAPPPSAPGSLLGRLKMPGKSGPVGLPQQRQAPAQPSVPVAMDPPPGRAPIGRRPMAPPSGLAGYTHPSEPPMTPGPGNMNAYGGGYHEESSHADVQRLTSENKELRKLLSEMKQLLQEASEAEQQKDKENEAKLAEKEAQVQELSAQLGAIEEQIAKGELAPPPPVPKTRSELEEWSLELEREHAQIQQARKRIEEDRQQLREDEEALEKQMREMEVSMARERALLARQETELKRLNNEIQHELELMQRGDANLREQMSKFQRRAQEVMNKPGGGGGAGGGGGGRR